MKPLEENKGPRPVEIVIAGILSGIVGVLGAAVFLAFQPAEKVTEIPEAEDRSLGTLYYVEGKGGSSEDDTWKAKKSGLEAARSARMTLTEEELNQWAAQDLKMGAAPDQGFLVIEPGTPRFRIADDILMVRVPLTLRLFGNGRTFDSQASGSFVRRGADYGFEYDRFYIGSCPVPGFVSSRLVKSVVATYDVSDELRSGWSALGTVELDGGSLRLMIP
jgi:hypothetical protein